MTEAGTNGDEIVGDLTDEQKLFVKEIKDKLSNARQSGILTLGVLDELQIEIDDISIEMNRSYGPSDFPDQE